MTEISKLDTLATEAGTYAKSGLPLEEIAEKLGISVLLAKALLRSNIRKAKSASPQTARNKQIIDDYQERRKTAAELSIEHGLTRQRLYQILERLPLKHREIRQAANAQVAVAHMAANQAAAQQAQAALQQALALVQGGSSVYEASRRTGIASPTIRAHCKLNKVKLRYGRWHNREDRKKRFMELWTSGMPQADIIAKMRAEEHPINPNSEDLERAVQKFDRSAHRAAMKAYAAVVLRNLHDSR